MKEDEEGKRKIDKSDERIAHKIAKDIEKAEHKRKAEEEKTDQITKDDQDAEQEEQVKKRRREEEDHKTAASSGDQATIDVGSGIAPGGVAADKGIEESVISPSDKRGEKRKAEEDIDRDTDPGMDIDRMEEKSDAELKNFVDRKITELGAE